MATKPFTIPRLLEAFEVANSMFINKGVRFSKADHSPDPPLCQTHKHKVEYDLNLIYKANSERMSRGLERTTLDYKTEALSTRPCRHSGFLQVLSGLANAFNWNPAKTNQEQLISPSSLEIPVTTEVDCITIVSVTVPFIVIKLYIHFTTEENKLPAERRINKTSWLFAIYVGKPVGSRLGQMVSKIQEW